ncbi:MAG: mandelate racemase/muconate lactonizing enzyme family protein, partial [Bryobacteraceae bacterium]
MKLTRRDFIRPAACVPFLAGYRLLAEPEKGRYKIRDVQSMVLSGPRTYTLVRVVADNGASGIAEAYGSPAIGVKEQILDLKLLLVGKDPLGIDALYTHLGEGGKSLSGTRTDGSAHSLMRAASGIEMALWDLAGRLLGQPVTTLLGGKFRDRVRVYDHEAPKNMLDKSSCREWAAKVKEDKSGFTAHKFGFPHTSEAQDGGRDPGNRVLSTKEMIDIGKGYENCR